MSEKQFQSDVIKITKKWAGWFITLMIVVDVMIQLDKPYRETPRSTPTRTVPRPSKKKHVSPAEKLLKALKDEPQTRLTMYGFVGLTKEQGNKVWQYFCKTKKVEKTGEKSKSGDSLWKAC